MTHVCHGACHRYASPTPHRDQYYQNGMKLCTICTKWFDYPLPRCVCCSASLRVGARDKSSRRAERNVLDIGQI